MANMGDCRLVVCDANGVARSFFLSLSLSLSLARFLSCSLCLAYTLCISSVEESPLEVVVANLGDCRLVVCDGRGVARSLSLTHTHTLSLLSSLSHTLSVFIHPIHTRRRLSPTWATAA